MQAELEKLISEIKAHSLSDGQFEQLHQYQDKLDELEAFIVKHENDGIRDSMLQAAKAFMLFRKKIINKPFADFDYLKGNIAYMGWKNEGIERNHEELWDTLVKLEQLNQKNLQVRVYALLGIASVDYHHGDYETSLSNLDKINALLPSFSYENVNFFQISVYANMHNSYGLAYRAINNFNKALSHFKISLSILELHTINTQLDGPKFALMNNITAIFTIQKKWKQALDHSNKYFPFAQQQLNKAKTLNYVKVQLSTFLITVSLSYIHLDQFNKANEQLALAEKIIEGVETDYRFMNTNLLYCKSILQRKTGNYNIAIQHAQQAFHYIFADFNSVNIEDNPNIQEVDFDKIQKLIIDPFVAKAAALLACYQHQNKDLELLKICLKTIDRVAVYFDAMRANYKGQLTKFSLGYFSKNLYEIGQLACWYLYEATAKIEYAEKAFAYANSSKALVLLEEMHQKWMNETDINFRVEQIQSTLKAHEVILEYSVGEMGIFVFLLSKNKPIQFKYIDETNGKQLEQHVNHWLKNHFNIYQPNQYETYQKEAYAISAQLILPYIKYIESGTTLLIAPDGFLNALPFEALVYETKTIDSYAEIDYFIDKFTFAYTFSSYLLYVSRQKDYSKKSNHFLYLSPNFLANKNLQEYHHIQQQQQALLEKAKLTTMNFNAQPFIEYDNREIDLTLLDDEQSILISKVDLFNLINQRKEQAPAPLLYNATMIEKLCTILNKQFLNVTLLKNKDARIKTFQKKSIHADFLLISSHAETEKGIMLYDEKGDGFTFLSYENIVEQNLQAQLVVLNMCDSGRGKNVFGEGYLSLGRAFFAAGSHNVVQTLYKVSDKYSALLIDSFFVNLVQQQLNFYEALRKAKLLLRNDRNGHPKFWAGHVIYGKNGHL